MASTSNDKVLKEVSGSVKFKKADGTFMLLGNRITWTPKEKGGKKFQCLYSDIKVQRISPETSSKVQLQVVFHNDSSYNFHFVNSEGRPIQLKDRDDVKEQLAELIPQHKQKANKDLEEKNRIFKEKPELFQLYKELVVSGIITSDEFWENQNVNVNKPPKDGDNQDVGIASGFLGELKPDMHGCNELRFNLTADNINAIFKMYPGVKKKYVDTVPSKETEKEFWTEFFQSQHFHRDRIQISASSKDVFGDLAKKDEDAQLKKVSENFFDPLIDFTSASPFPDEGYGSGFKPKLQNEVLLKQFNHQSLIVLENIKRKSSDKPEDAYETKKHPSKHNNNTTENVMHEFNDPVAYEISTRNNALIVFDVDSDLRRIREAVGLEDLETKDVVKVISLKVLDTDKFSYKASTGTDANGHTNGTSQQDLTQFKKDIQAWTPKLYQAISAADARQVICDASPGGRLMPESSKSKIGDTVPVKMKTEMRKNYTSLAELLRHFWSCFPIRTPQLEEKVRRMATSIEKYRDTKLNNFNCMQPSSCNQLGNHMSNMIDIALKKYRTWEEKRSTKSLKT